MRRLVILTLLLSACATTDTPVNYDVAVTRDLNFTETLQLDIFAPTTDDEFPAVVLFHGGSWYGGQKENIEDFARLLASKGLIVFNATYTVGGNGGGYPESYEDLRCALSFASSASGETPLTVVGHSAGAHLSSTVILSGDRFASDKCTDDSPITVGGFVGLAGPYEADRYGPLLVNWFGTTIQDDPEPWSLGSPYGYLVDADPIPMALVHGSEDTVVQLGFSEEFAAVVLASGLNVTLTVIDGADHGSIIDPQIDGDQVAALVLERASLASN